MTTTQPAMNAAILSQQPQTKARNDRIRVGEKVYLRKRGKSGKYVAEFWHNGQNCKKSMQTSDKQIAMRRALKLEAELLADTYAVQAKPVLITAAIQEYLEVKEGENCGIKTITKYRQWLNAFENFLQLKHATKLQQITPQQFENFRASKKVKLSPKSMHTGLMIVKSFMNWCSSPGRGYIPINPVKGCKVPEPYVHPKFSPSRAQVTAILASASGTARAQYAVLAFSGLRAGEMQMLRPQDVDLAQGWIYVVGRTGWVPKTRQNRNVPIHPLLMEALNAYAAKLPQTAQVRPYFFCAKPSTKYPKGGHTIDLRKLNVRFQKLAKTLNIKTGRKQDGLVIHSLRHFFETQSVNSGIPQVVIDSWMGHAGDGSMARVYYGRKDKTSKQFMKHVRFVKKPKLQVQPVSV